MSAELVTQAIDVHYFGLKALNSVDFRLGAGEVVGLIGPNGSGKTTLLNVLSGVTLPSSGRVMINGDDVTSLPAHRIARLGVARTFQHIRLFDNLTVLQNVQIGSALDVQRNHGTTLRDSAIATVEVLGLVPHQERKAGTLPYGVRRRVEIARALAMKPLFLLLDEPAAGANQIESEELGTLIAQIAEDYELGILVIEHDLSLVMRVASRVVVLNEGKVIARGSAEAVSRDVAVREAYFGRRWAEAQQPISQPLDEASNKEML